MDTLLRQIKRLIPARIFTFFQPFYHYGLALLGALIYRFPSRQITLVGVTGTKGKTTVIELLNAIFEHAGYTTALASTWRIKIGEESERNMRKMTMPGRMFVPRFLRRAVNNKCDIVFLEMTSEGAKQFRHAFLDLDALIFTNLTPEHIESHGSYENYVQAKLSIARALAGSRKPHPLLVVNENAHEADRFRAISGPDQRPFALSDAAPYTLRDRATTFTFSGHEITLALPGVFNIENALAAATLAQSYGIATETIAHALSEFAGVRGRMEHIDEGQPYRVIVDYAHTPESLEHAYRVYENTPKICVLGATGGGRDKGKRRAMGEVADRFCDIIVLTNEDPYDENPERIVRDVREGVAHTEIVTIMDRREAIHYACQLAHPGHAVYITGKGTDPYIMEANGKRTPWDDAQVAREEIRAVARES